MTTMRVTSESVRAVTVADIEMRRDSGFGLVCIPAKMAATFPGL